MKLPQNIRFTFQSCADLNDIWEAIAVPKDIFGSAGSDNLEAAERFADHFEKVCMLLPNHPEIALARDDLHPGLRSIILQRYVVLFRVRGKSVEVLRILPATRAIDFGIVA